MRIKFSTLYTAAMIILIVVCGGHLAYSFTKFVIEAQAWHKANAPKPKPIATSQK